MKNIISIMLIASLGMLLVFSGCKKDEYVPEELKKVTLSGSVKTDMHLGVAGLEKVPDGTKIIFRIDSRDLCAAPVAGYTYEVLQYETTVTGGTYTITLPTVKFNGVTVNIVPVDFTAKQVQGDLTEKDKVFTGVTASVVTMEGERYFQDLTFSVW